MTDPLDWIDDQLVQLDERHVRRHLVDRVSRQDVRVTIAGRELVNFAANDYLGLASDERLIAAAKSAVDEYGWGGGASPLITGHTQLHRALEEAIAKFEDCESALLFPTGYAANVGTITALVGNGDTVFSDAKNHASIIDGCRLSGADVRIYQHGDSDDLRRQLTTISGTGKKLIVTDGLFSMDGDVAPLGDLVDLADEFAAMLMVDEAHATGVLGESGRGTCELCGVEQRVPIRVGTLSKALGTLGGFVVGSQKLIDWLVNRSRPYIFSTAAPPAVAAAGLAALEIVQQEPARRQELMQLSDHLRTRLNDAHFCTGTSTTQIVPVILGDAQRTMQLAARLREAGLIVPGIRPPSVPAGESLLRISLSAAHSTEMVADLIDQLLTLR